MVRVLEGGSGSLEKGMFKNGRKGSISNEREREDGRRCHRRRHDEGETHGIRGRGGKGTNEQEREEWRMWAEGRR